MILFTHTYSFAFCHVPQLLSLFTSSFFLAGMLSSLFASYVTEKYGRKASMCAGAILYLLGSLLNVLAKDTAMLIAGRLILGLGCGFANQAVPVFLAEIPPPESRGALQVCFQIFVNIGVLVAGIVNYYTSQVDYGWRISLGVFIPPALILLVGSMFLPETPSFLYRSGKATKAQGTLQKLRGLDANIEEEWRLIQDDVKESKKHGNPAQQLKTLLSRPYRGELTVACFIAIFSQLTGISSMLYYTPKDSLVFGGNFVHMHSLEMQLTIFRLEKKMRVGKDYKFPYYQKLMWFVAWDFLKQRDGLMVQLCDKKDGKTKGARDQKSNRREPHSSCRRVLKSGVLPNTRPAPLRLSPTDKRNASPSSVACRYCEVRVTHS